MDPLSERILALSKSKFIENALYEWVIDYDEEPESTSCICGHSISRIFKAKNTINGNVISPLGCVCIEKFKGDSRFYQSFKKCQRVWCDDCGTFIINQPAFNVHIHCEKHKRNIGSWPCEDCGVRITSDNEKWITRCKKCYVKNIKKNPKKKRYI